MSPFASSANTPIVYDMSICSSSMHGSYLKTSQRSNDGYEPKPTNNMNFGIVIVGIITLVTTSSSLTTSHNITTFKFVKKFKLIMGGAISTTQFFLHGRKNFTQ